MQTNTLTSTRTIGESMERKTKMVEGCCPECKHCSDGKEDFTCTYVEFYDPMTEYTCPKCGYTWSPEA